MNEESFLQNTQEGLNGILRPFQQELKRGQRFADFLQQCIRCVVRNDFLQLDELLRTKKAENVEQEEALIDCKPVFDSLREYAREQVERYRLQFIKDFDRLAEEAGLPVKIDFPRFSVLEGIDGEIIFSKRITIINKKTLKSIDPRRIVTAALRVKKQLYDRPFDPQKFIDGLYETYAKISKMDNISQGNPVPILRFYLEYVISLQSKTFFTNMDKAKFRGYGLEQFGVDIWRYFKAGIGGASNGKKLCLDPGRNYFLWLIDSNGEPRQISGISFLEDEI
ncbi:MAG: hypothetical protein KAI50_01980 [Desulfobacterales bacterium]|nr:hypothetical protein [Desulfobacterales bacterium]